MANFRYVANFTFLTLSVFFHFSLFTFSDELWLYALLFEGQSPVAEKFFVLKFKGGRGVGVKLKGKYSRSKSIDSNKATLVQNELSGVRE